MKPRDAYFSRAGRYTLGVDGDSGRHYLSIPVSSGAADYEKYYELAEQHYGQLLADQAAALAFAEECRRREHDGLLLQKPGWNRGTPA